MSWIMTDEGRLLNLDHFTRLDWKEVKERNDTYYQVLAVKDFSPNVEKNRIPFLSHRISYQCRL